MCLWRDRVYPFQLLNQLGRCDNMQCWTPSCSMMGRQSPSFRPNFVVSGSAVPVIHWRDWSRGERRRSGTWPASGMARMGHATDYATHGLCSVRSAELNWIDRTEPLGLWQGSDGYWSRVQKGELVGLWVSLCWNMFSRGCVESWRVLSVSCFFFFLFFLPLKVQSQSCGQFYISDGERNGERWASCNFALFRDAALLSEVLYWLNCWIMRKTWSCIAVLIHLLTECLHYLPGYTCTVFPLHFVEPPCICIPTTGALDIGTGSRGAICTKSDPMGLAGRWETRRKYVR